MSNILKLVYWDDPALSTVCEKVADNEFGPELSVFAMELKATMDDRNGVGLAAPQVGVTKRIFAMHFPDGYKSDEKPEPIVVINPELELSGRTLNEREGCLSVPGIYEQVARAEKVVMHYRNIYGKPSVLDLSDINARVAQHEFDHLNGIMFFNFQDIRPTFGRRMSKQLSKHVLREWDREKAKRGL